MSQAAVDPLTAPGDLNTRRRPGYLMQVVRGTVARHGARIGLVWIILIAFCAIFAPFLANSHPYIMKTSDGQTSFPLFAYLSPVDVLLPLASVVVVALTLLPVGKPRWRVLSMGVLIAAIAGGSFLWVDPPLREVHRFREYRAGEVGGYGQVEWMVRPPIPYSARDRQKEMTDVRYIPPGEAGHLMGTEKNGADVLSRMIHACRIALAVGFIATGIGLFIGVIVGGAMGYFSGIVDLIGMRIVEMFAAIPTFFLLLTLVALIPPEWNPYKLYLMMVVIGLTGWVGYARFTRAEFLKLRQQDFVQAARAVGLPLRSILFRHMLPNGMAPVLVEASFGVASAILYESVLSFLGLGLVDDPSWGQMLSEALGPTGGFKWWMAVFPGLAIFFTVFAYNLVGEALRDALDPHTAKN